MNDLERAALSARISLILGIAEAKQRTDIVALAMRARKELDETGSLDCAVAFQLGWSAGELVELEIKK